MSDVHKIDVSLSEPDLVLDPGSVAQLSVTITNRQDTPDRLSLEIEGIDVEWYAIPVPAVNVAAGEQAVLKVPFKVARFSGNLAGTYPFLVRVQAMESGNVGVAQASLSVKAFNALQVELTPKRAVASFFRPLNDFDVAISNEGNVDETLDLFASDPDDGCAYEYDTDRITVRTGQTIVVPLAIRPKVSALFGGTRIYGFTASARSTDDSYVSANAHGQIEKHALISPLFGIFLLLAAIAGGAFVIFRPKPPEVIRIVHFTATPRVVDAGTGATLTWEVSGLSPNDRHLLLTHRVGENGTEIQDGELPSYVGNQPVKADPPFTVYTLTARGSSDQKPAVQSVKVTVLPPKPVPKPIIKQFVVTPRKIHVGDTVSFSWSALNHKSFILDPGNKQLSQFEESAQDTPTQDTEYKLRAFNAKGDFVSKSVLIKVVPPNVCIAEIDFFGIKGPVYAGSSVRLRWSTHYARAVHIDSSDTTIVIGDVSTGEGSQDIVFPTTNPVTLTLTATDSANKAISKAITITPQVRPLPPAPQPGATPPNPSGGLQPGNAAPDSKIGGQ